MDYSSLEEVALTQQLVQIESSNPGTYEGNVSDFVSANVRGLNLSGNTYF